MPGFFESLVNLTVYFMPKKAGKIKLASLPFPCSEASSDIGTVSVVSSM